MGISALGISKAGISKRGISKPGILASNTRYAYSMDGIDDRWTLANRAINPDGDIDIEWVSGPSINLSTSRTIISQTLTTTAASQEFFAFIGTNGNLAVRVGGVERGTFPQIVYQPNTKYRWRLQGTTVNLWVNDVLQPVMTMTRGAAREPSSVTTIGAAVNSFFYLGALYNVKINGTLWKMDQRNQSIQPSEPAGNNMTGTNLNPDRWVEIPK